jgi:hypothetical protein
MDGFIGSPRHRAITALIATRYTYSAIADRTGRPRRGPLAPGFRVDRNGADFGGYDDSEIQRQARRLALATATKIFRGN